MQHKLDHEVDLVPTVIHSSVGAGMSHAISFAWDISQRWGPEVATAGFTSVPNYLLSINQFLEKHNRLSSTELLVLLQILSYWWYTDRLPFPSKSTIAKRLGLSPRQVQRALTGLVKKQIIERVARSPNNKGRASNAYDMTRLIEKLRIVAAQHPAAFPRQPSYNLQFLLQDEAHLDKAKP